MRSAVWCLALVIGFFCASPAHAQSDEGAFASCDPLMDAGLFPVSNVAIGKITGTKEIMAIDTIQGHKMYDQGPISVGRTVAIFEKTNGYSCITTADYNHGWVPDSLIKVTNNSDINPKQLIGKWLFARKSFEITQNHGKILIDGEASFYNPDGNTIEGQFEGELKLDHNKIIYKDRPDTGSDCEMSLILIDDRLLLLDPRKCDGGTNINFTEFYDKKNKRSHKK